MTRLLVTLILLSCIVPATKSTSYAAGVDVSRRFSISDSQLGGYTPHPVTGYKQGTLWGLATSTNNSFALIFDYVSNTSQPLPTALADPTWITIVDPTGSVISREELPVDLQPSLEDCKNLVSINGAVPTQNGCSTGQYGVTPIQQLPNKLLVSALWYNYNDNSLKFHQIFYILDLTAPISCRLCLDYSNRWTLISNTRGSNTPVSTPTFSPLTFPTVYFYDSSRIGTTSVYTITNK